MIEAHVEAWLDDGTFKCWSADVSWREDFWLIDPSVLVNDDQGQRVLKDFPDRTSQTVDDFISQFKQTIADLSAHALSMYPIE